VNRFPDCIVQSKSFDLIRRLKSESFILFEQLSALEFEFFFGHTVYTHNKV
jgi:hypothetical protein